MSDLDTFNHMTQQFYTDAEIAQGKDVKQRLLDVLEDCKTSMSVFDRPNWLKPDTTVTRTMKPERLSIEGRWRNVRRIVQELIDDGWRQTTIVPNDEFTLTTVVMER